MVVLPAPFFPRKPQIDPPGTRKSSNPHVGQRNVEVARMLVKKHGFVSMAEHLGGSVEGMVPANVLSKLRDKFQKK